MLFSFSFLEQQAALPQGIVPFVFAKEYNVHPDILSTGYVYSHLSFINVSNLLLVIIILKIVSGELELLWFVGLQGYLWDVDCFTDHACLLHIAGDLKVWREGFGQAWLRPP